MTSPHKPLDSRRAFVTGGAKGIGAAIARRLAADAANVVIADIDVEAAAPLAEEIGAVAAALDVTDAAQVASVIA
jgi:NAD(P)-dependent dehydrogenase (short-subunit alcohol dehydrogenase family)